MPNYPSSDNSITRRRHAMATEFSVTIAHADRQYAAQAAAECLDELARLEELLSRFLGNSDVARIGRAIQGAAIRVAPDTLDCLRTALQIEVETAGAFNIAYRHRPPRLSSDLLRLSEPPPTVHVSTSHVPLDLGGIGKGFALDRMAAILRQWELPCFLLCGSTSTLLAGAPPPGKRGWPVRFGPATDRHRLELRHAALSGSGTAGKGNHIIDPRTSRPATHFVATWIGTASATHADALSTALMVMSIPAIKELLRRRKDDIGFVQETQSKVLRSFQAESISLFH